MLEAGKMAPDFSAQDENGNTVKLSAFRGKKVVLYFYPRDNTPGCTTEACAFRDVYDAILEMGAVVIGVSADSVKSHSGFREKHGLPFHLLSDPDREIIMSYGAWGEKKLYGKLVSGLIRSTFIIDEKGIIKKVFPKVSPKEHASEVLAALEAFKA